MCFVALIRHHCYKHAGNSVVYQWYNVHSASSVLSLFFGLKKKRKVKRATERRLSQDDEDCDTHTHHTRACAMMIMDLKKKSTHIVTMRTFCFFSCRLRCFSSSLARCSGVIARNSFSLFSSFAFSAASRFSSAARRSLSFFSA